MINDISANGSLTTRKINISDGILCISLRKYIRRLNLQSTFTDSIMKGTLPSTAMIRVNGHDGIPFLFGKGRHEGDSLVLPQSVCNYDVMHSVVLRYILCPGIC